MKKQVRFFLVMVFWVWMCSTSWAGESKKLELNLKDGKVSADVQDASLAEVAGEIGKRWGIAVEIYEGGDKGQTVSAAFTDLSILDSIYRLFRGTNFLYVVGERLYVLGFRKGGVGDGVVEATVSSPTRGSLSKGGETKPYRDIREEQSEKSGRMGTDRVRDGKEGERDFASIGIGGGGASSGTNLPTGGTQNPSETNQGKEPMSVIGSLTTSMIFEGGGKAITAISMDISFDSTLIGNPRVVAGDSTKQAGKEIVFNQVRPGLLRVGVIGLNQNVIPDGVVAQITFDLFKEGTISLGIQPTGSDSHGNKVPVVIREAR